MTCVMYIQKNENRSPDLIVSTNRGMEFKGTYLSMDPITNLIILLPNARQHFIFMGTFTYLV